MRRFFSSYTSMLILINVIIFLLSLIFIAIFGNNFFELFALIPSLFFAGYLWTPLTSMFLHSPVMIFHIFANMISLFFVGLFLERIVGKKRFLGIYLISGIFAGIFAATLAYFFGVSVPIDGFLNLSFNERIRFALFGSPIIPAVGASGAIFGLIGLIAMLTPRNRIYFLSGPVLAIILPFILSTINNEFIQPILSFINIIAYIYVIFSFFAILSFNRNLIKYALPVEMSFKLLPVIAIVPLVIVRILLPSSDWKFCTFRRTYRRTCLWLLFKEKISTKSKDD
jgi:membrane associated rhomboid family serine protease